MSAKISKAVAWQEAKNKLAAVAMVARQDDSSQHAREIAEIIDQVIRTFIEYFEERKLDQ